MTITDVAWLAGLWDGEGSVGACWNKPRHEGGVWVIRPQIQLSMTHVPTVERAAAILTELGCDTTVRMTAPAKRVRPHHKDAAYLNVSRSTHLVAAAQALGPMAVTKAEQWTLLEELARLRVARGRRVGPNWTGYTEREGEIVDQLLAVNQRGSASPERGAESAHLGGGLDRP